MDKSTREIIEEIRLHLPEYLESQGFTVHRGGVRNMRCPIPSCSHKHNDRNASARLVRGSNDTVLHCFASGRSMDIFQIAYEYEGLPVGRDKKFYSVTVPTLADRFGIAHQ